MGALLAAGSASAATFTVTNLNDAGAGSLRQAVIDANTAVGADTIVFQSGLTGTIALTTGEIDITDPVTINGPGAPVITISGDGSAGILHIENNLSTTPITVDINNVTVTNGAPAAAAVTSVNETLTLNQVVITGSAGGGIILTDTDGASLTVTNSTITGNSGPYVGGILAYLLAGSVSITNSTISSNNGFAAGGIFVGGGATNVTITGSTISGNTGQIYAGGLFLYTEGAVSITGSTITGNTSVHGSGGGIFAYLSGTGSLSFSHDTVSSNVAGNSGGGIAAVLYGTGGIGLTIANTLVTGNSAGTTTEGAVYGGGVAIRDGSGGSQSIIVDSIISGNTAGNNGIGGGLYDYASPLTIQRTTINGNTAYRGGGIYTEYGTATLENATIVGNQAHSTISPGSGGGIGSYTTTLTINETTITNNTADIGGGGIDADTGSTITLSNSVLANNTGASPTPDIDSAGTVSATYTLIKDAGTTTIGGGTGNITGTDPNLGSLAVNRSTIVAGATGSTQTPMTELPVCASPVINTGDPAFTPPPTTDERGMPRVAGGRIDMGAVEFQPSSVQLSTAGAAVIENGGSITVTAVRTGADGPLSVNYATADGSAKGTASGIGTPDYTPASGTLTWTDGDTANKTFAVSITDDAVFEGNETFSAALSSPTCGASLGANAVETITIAENDPPPTISIGNVTQAEGNSGVTPFVFTVALSAPSAQITTVNFATANGTALSAAGAPGNPDYTPASGTLTFNPGETSKTISVNVNGDAVSEPNEAFTVNLSSATNATIAVPTGTGTITNDDPLPSLSIGNVAQAEGNSGTTAFVFTVTLSQASGQTVSVAYATANGTASNAASGPGNPDYTATSGTLTFNPGETTKTITVNVNGDTVAEGNENFTVSLSSPVNATITTATGTGTINDDDAAPTLAIGNVSQSEGNSGTTVFTFPVTLSQPSGQVVTVNYATADGTATSSGSGADYTPAGGTLTFNPGETSKTITVNVNGDALAEPNETFTVNLTSPVNAAIGTATGTGTILNDDGAPVLSIASVSQNEGTSGTTPFVFTVTLSPASGQVVTVNYATADGTAASSGTGADYTAASGTLTFNPGETSKTITVNVNGDIVCEPNETFSVTLSSPANATIGTATATGTIVNDDPCAADLSIVKTLHGGPIFIAGSNITYTLATTNLGPGTATSVVVTDALPAGMAFVSSTPSQGTCTGTTTVTCSLGTLVANASATIDLVVKAPNHATSNTASVSAATTDPNPANNTSTVAADIPALTEKMLALLAAVFAALGAWFAGRKS